MVVLEVINKNNNISLEETNRANLTANWSMFSQKLDNSLAISRLRKGVKYFLATIGQYLVFVHVKSNYYYVQRGEGIYQKTGVTIQKTCICFTVKI